MLNMVPNDLCKTVVEDIYSEDIESDARSFTTYHQCLAYLAKLERKK